jgi:hypothetical protein
MNLMGELNRDPPSECNAVDSIIDSQDILEFVDCVTPRKGRNPVLG